MNRVEVTSCSHSQGWPMVRVTMSAVTDNEKPKQSRPHSTIKPSSSLSNTGHFRCPCRCSTSLSAMAIEYSVVLVGRPGDVTRGSVDCADQILDLLRVRSEILG